jgi:hypothetical protein
MSGHIIELDPRTMEKKLEGLYSADVIIGGKIRGIYTHGGKNYAITGLHWHHGLQVARATEAIPLKMWSGPVCTYSDKKTVTDEQRERLYEGIKVKCKGDVYVLSGARIEFVPGQSKSVTVIATPVQMSLF